MAQEQTSNVKMDRLITRAEMQLKNLQRSNSPAKQQDVLAALEQIVTEFGEPSAWAANDRKRVLDLSRQFAKLAPLHQPRLVAWFGDEGVTDKDDNPLVKEFYDAWYARDFGRVRRAKSALDAQGIYSADIDEHMARLPQMEAEAQQAAASAAETPAEAAAPLPAEAERLINKMESALNVKEYDAVLSLYEEVEGILNRHNVQAYPTKLNQFYESATVGKQVKAIIEQHQEQLDAGDFEGALQTLKKGVKDHKADVDLPLYLADLEVHIATERDLDKQIAELDLSRAGDNAAAAWTQLEQAVRNLYSDLGYGMNEKGRWTPRLGVLRRKRAALLDEAKRYVDQDSRQIPRQEREARLEKARVLLGEYLKLVPADPTEAQGYLSRAETIVNNLENQYQRRQQLNRIGIFGGIGVIAFAVILVVVAVAGSVREAQAVAQQTAVIEEVTQAALNATYGAMTQTADAYAIQQQQDAAARDQAATQTAQVQSWQQTQVANEAAQTATAGAIQATQAAENQALAATQTANSFNLTQTAQALAATNDAIGNQLNQTATVIAMQATQAALVLQQTLSAEQTARAIAGAPDCNGLAIRSVNLRQGPGTSEAVMGGLQTGDGVRIYGWRRGGGGSNTGWYCVAEENDQREGPSSWVSADFISAPNCPNYASLTELGQLSGVCAAYQGP